MSAAENPLDGNTESQEQIRSRVAHGCPISARQPWVSSTGVCAADSSQSDYRDRSQTSKDHLSPIAHPRAYDGGVFARIEIGYQKRTENRLKAQAKALGYALVPAASGGIQTP